MTILFIKCAEFLGCVKRAFALFFLAILPLSLFANGAGSVSTQVLLLKKGVLQQQEVESEIHDLHSLDSHIHHSSLVTEQHYQKNLKIVERFLEKKWIVKDSNRKQTISSIKAEMADYFAKRPAAFKLISSLKKQPISLRYTPDVFKTEVKGNSFSVRRVIVHFDPFSAVQLRDSLECKNNPAHCTVSSADALLHELLHAREALLNEKAFIASGAMNSVVYPYEHEMQVIGMERQIYRELSFHDGIKRPMRYSHTGQLIISACVTCLPEFTNEEESKEETQYIAGLFSVLTINSKSFTF